MNRRNRYDTGPIRRAFDHHDTSAACAGARTAFEFHGATDPAAQAGRQRLTVTVNGHREDLTPREAWLVAQALVAGRNIETTAAARRTGEDTP